MVAYSFRPRFVEPILAGTKRQTIRATGLRRHARPGDALQLYTGMRTRHCRLIKRATCTALDDVVLYFTRHNPAANRFTVNGVDLTRAAMEQFAIDDGFGREAGSPVEEMARFWFDDHGTKGVWDLAFIGKIIRWE